MAHEAFARDEGLNVAGQIAAPRASRGDSRAGGATCHAGGATTARAANVGAANVRAANVRAANVRAAAIVTGNLIRRPRASGACDERRSDNPSHNQRPRPKCEVHAD